MVGLGRIGTLVAQRLAPFGVQLVAYDPTSRPRAPSKLGVALLSLPDLMAQSDFITCTSRRRP